MVQITRDEAMAVRKALPRVHIRKTCHKYYMEQAPKALTLVNKMRNVGLVETVMPVRKGR